MLRITRPGHRYAKHVQRVFLSTRFFQSISYSHPFSFLKWPRIVCNPNLTQVPWAMPRSIGHESKSHGWPNRHNYIMTGWPRLLYYYLLEIALLLLSKVKLFVIKGLYLTLSQIGFITFDSTLHFILWRHVILSTLAYMINIVPLFHCSSCVFVLWLLIFAFIKQISYWYKVCLSVTVTFDTTSNDGGWRPRWHICTLARWSSCQLVRIKKHGWCISG